MATTYDRRQDYYPSTTKTHFRHDQSGDPIRYSQRHDQGPSSSKIMAIMGLLPIGAILLGLSGITLVGTIIGLAIATPVFIIFSPVIVPAVLTIALAVAGFMTSGAFGLTGLSSLSYLVNLLRQSAGSLPEQMDYLKDRIQDAGEYAGQKTKDVAQTIQDKAHEMGEQGQGYGGDRLNQRNQYYPTTAQTHFRYDQSGNRIPYPQQHEGASSGKAMAIMGLLPVGAILLGLAGVTFVGTLIGLAVATPVFIIFSPVIVPAVLTIGLAVTAFLTSGTLALTGLSSLSYLVNTVRQSARSLPEQMDYVREMIQDVGDYAGQKTKDAGQTIQNKAHEIGEQGGQGQGGGHVGVGIGAGGGHGGVGGGVDVNVQAGGKEGGKKGGK